jgi:hypothetical protein
MHPRWLSWLFILVMLYMIYASSQSRLPAVVPTAPVAVPTTQAQQAFTALSEMTDIERWKRGINPDYAAKMNCSVDAAKTPGTLTIKAVEEVAGTGKEAACGETITIHLTVWNAGGTKAFEGELPLALGSRQLASGLDAGLVGISTGGVRTLLLPPNALVHNAVKTSSNKDNADLVAAQKALPKDKVTLVTVKRVK